MIAPNPQEVATANYGAYPTDLRQIVDRWMRDTLYDPHSVLDLEIGPPSKYVLQEAPLMGGGRTFGYLVQAKLNAKNRMGGYTGRKTVNLIIRNGEVVKSWEEGQVVI
jgi:hypothetical protein